MTTPPQHRSRVPAALLLTLLAFSRIIAQTDSSSESILGAGEGSTESSGVPSEDATVPSDSPAGIDLDSAPSADRPYWRQNLFGRFFRDQKYLFTTWWPSEFRRSGFTMPLVAGTLLATTSYRAEGEQQDVLAEAYLKSEAKGGGEAPARALSFLGNAGTGALLIGSGYLIGRWSHHDQLAEASSLSAEALLSAGLWSSVLKTVSGRTRPGGGSEGRFFTYHPSAHETPGSFPSGHATGAFAVATVFAHVYQEHRWVSWVAYGTAGLIGAARVAQGRHYPSDVIVGGLLGNSFGRMAVARGQDEGRPSSTLRPYFDPTVQGSGVMWTHDW
jgi:membrane-associated phospholipid phosphatase